MVISRCRETHYQEKGMDWRHLVEVHTQALCFLVIAAILFVNPEVVFLRHTFHIDSVGCGG